MERNTGKLFVIGYCFKFIAEYFQQLTSRGCTRFEQFDWLKEMFYTSIIPCEQESRNYFPSAGS